MGKFFLLFSFPSPSNSEKIQRAQQKRKEEKKWKISLHTLMLACLSLYLCQCHPINFARSTKHQQLTDSRKKKKKKWIGENEWVGMGWEWVRVSEWGITEQQKMSEWSEIKVAFFRCCCCWRCCDGKKK